MSAPNTASVATGSTAETSAPYVIDSEKPISTSVTSDRFQTATPTMMVEIDVPTSAQSITGPRLPKKRAFFAPKPASKMIIGSSTRLNVAASKRASSSMWCECVTEPYSITSRPVPNPMIIVSPASGM